MDCAGEEMVYKRVLGGERKSPLALPRGSFNILTSEIENPDKQEEIGKGSKRKSE